MSEPQKAMTVTLVRADLYDSLAYTSAYLRLPANQSEIQDALERARITGDQPYKIVECFDSQGEYLEFIPENPPLAELNFLAQRISGLEDTERLAFTGRVKMEQSPPDMKKLINITYNLSDCHVINGVGSDKELGKFYVENDMVEVLLDVPDEVLNYLDYEKIGRFRREEEKGVFIDKCYVINDAVEFKEVYDGVHLPWRAEKPDYVFKLQIAEAPFGRWPDFENEPNNEHCVPLLLPAVKEDVQKALEQLETASLEECVFYHCESVVPALNQVFDFSEDIDKMNILAGRIKALDDRSELAKYKAVLEFTDCTDIDFALDLAQNLDCFDFYPEMSSPEDYGRLALLKTSGLKPDDPAFQYLGFVQYGHAMMRQDKASATGYGLVLRNEKELVPEYSQQPKEIGQQML